MQRLPSACSRVVLVAMALGAAAPAAAIPAFARKYGTSCLTCHTVYPKLTPFGEAFRRNGYRFPGIDSDYVKQETVPLGQEANKKTFPRSVWPATLPTSLPVAIGFNGQAALYPDSSASIPRTNKAAGGAATTFSFDDMVAEAHLWLGGALSDTVTTWGELTLANDGSTSLEHAQLLFNDLLGPPHVLNLVVGKGFPTLSSFGPHSSYAADAQIPNLPVTAMYGTGGDSFVLVDSYTGVEVNGVVEGRLQYATGLTNGKNSFGASFNSENAYASAGYKLGGMRLDGEGDTGPKDAMRPWAEESLTVHGFVYHSAEHFATPGGPDTSSSRDTSFTAGGGLRALYGSAELDLGYYRQSHDHGTDTLGKVTADALYGELSYVVYPWLVPTLRIERVGLRPSGGSSVSDLHLMPAVAFLIRPNVKLVVAGNVESADGFPSPGGTPAAWAGGSGDSGALTITPKTSDPKAKLTELESLTFFLAWAI
jgi:hypothetical protein